MYEPTFSAGFMIAILACLLVLPGWAQQPKRGGTLRVAWQADISGLDPHLSFGMQAQHVGGSLFNSLVTIDAEQSIVPDLAESWEIPENSKVYVFHLRQGVKFHDGTDFDAEVVRWHYQRVVDPGEKTLDASYYNIIAAIMKMQLAQIGVEVTIEVIDRPIFLRRLTNDRDWDQMVNLTVSFVDVYTCSFILDSRGSLN